MWRQSIRHLLTYCRVHLYLGNTSTQELFRCHVQLAHDLEDELTRWVLFLSPLLPFVFTSHYFVVAIVLVSASVFPLAGKQSSRFISPYAVSRADVLIYVLRASSSFPVR